MRRAKNEGGEKKRKKHEASDWGNYNPLRYVTTFSKALTYLWAIVWIEVVLFSEVAAMLQIGDSMAIQYINDSVKEIGLIVMGFYFGSKAAENIAEGYEDWRLKMMSQTVDIPSAEEEPE